MDSSPPDANVVAASLVSPTPRAVLGDAVLGTNQLGGGHVTASPLANLAVPLFRDNATVPLLDDVAPTLAAPSVLPPAEVPVVGAIPAVPVVPPLLAAGVLVDRQAMQQILAVPPTSWYDQVKHTGTLEAKRKYARRVRRKGMKFRRAVRARRSQVLGAEYSAGSNGTKTVGSVEYREWTKKRPSEHLLAGKKHNDKQADMGYDFYGDMPWVMSRFAAYLDHKRGARTFASAPTTQEVRDHFGFFWGEFLVDLGLPRGDIPPPAWCN